MLLQAAGWAGTAVDRSSTHRSSKEETPTARHGGGTVKRPRTAVTRPSGSDGEDRDFVCFLTQVSIISSILACLLDKPLLRTPPGLAN